MGSIPSEVVSFAADRLGVTEEEARDHSVRIDQDRATIFHVGGRGGRRIVVGDDRSILSIPSIFSTEWGMDRFREGIRNWPTPEKGWMQTDQENKLKDTISGRDPINTAAEVLGVGAEEIDDSAVLPDNLGATSFSHPARGAGAVIVGDDGGVLCTPSYLGVRDVIWIYKSGVRHSRSTIRRQRSTAMTSSASMAVSWFLERSTGQTCEAKPKILSTKEVIETIRSPLVVSDEESVLNELIRRGAGSHALIGWDRERGFSGHWLNGFYDGNEVWVIDAQRGKICSWPPSGRNGVVRWEVAVGESVS